MVILTWAAGCGLRDRCSRQKMTVFSVRMDVHTAYRRVLLWPVLFPPAPVLGHAEPEFLWVWRGQTHEAADRRWVERDEVPGNEGAQSMTNEIGSYGGLLLMSILVKGTFKQFYVRTWVFSHRTILWELSFWVPLHMLHPVASAVVGTAETLSTLPRQRPSCILNIWRASPSPRSLFFLNQYSILLYLRVCLIPFISIATTLQFFSARPLSWCLKPNQKSAKSCKQTIKWRQWRGPFST